MHTREYPLERMEHVEKLMRSYAVGDLLDVETYFSARDEVGNEFEGAEAELKTEQPEL